MPSNTSNCSGRQLEIENVGPDYKLDIVEESYPENHPAGPEGIHGLKYVK